MIHQDFHLSLSPGLRGGGPLAFHNQYAIDSCNTTALGASDIAPHAEMVEVHGSGKAATLLLVFETLSSHPLGFPGFIFLLMLFTVAGLPLTPLQVSAGAIFGAIWGSIGNQVGKTLGCVICLCIGRYFKTVRGWKMPEWLDKYLLPLKTRPFETMCLIRLSPLPLGVKNYGLSLVHFPDDHFPVVAYTCAAFLSSLPHSIICGIAGRGASSLADVVKQYT
mmetsp:Transcript_32645/g.76896  ORF Transcript_32645/g.76896 Transcript_32645/m.76896 type:complete len:221 (-) Transcript_32645:127-789(-)